MKATNLNLQKHLLLHPADGRKLNKDIAIYSRKATIPVCLFLLLSFHSIAQDFTFKPETRKAYDEVLNLNFRAAQEGIVVKGVEDEYVVALSEALELLTTEDAEKFSAWESNFERRVETKSKPDANGLFLQAELHLQWSFVYLKFGHEFDAALQLRKAYHLTREVRKKFPNYKPVLKTSGLLNVMVGSVPEKYNWVLDLLDMRGDVSKGLRELVELKNLQHDLSFESTLWHAFILGFVLQQPASGIEELTSHPMFANNAVANFLAANLYIKNSNSERALELLKQLQTSVESARFPYLSYLRGEILLHKGEYVASVEAYEEFLRLYHGQNYLKDAYYKKGICFWLQSNKPEAKRQFELAKDIGKETTEADKHAARALQDENLPSIPLIKLRYFTDGGYYSDALAVANSIVEGDFTAQKDKVEFHYRKARLYHKMKDLPRAILLYRSTIEESGNSDWYFAPNACLQLGFIAMEENRDREARDYFTRALSYKKHEYKNSIDSKARSALAQLRDRR
jgi:tetratricopeptide (TPR) repeat protein